MVKFGVFNKLGACGVVLLAAVALLLAGCGQGGPRDFKVGDRCFLLDGDTLVIKAAELHYPRIPEPYWRHRIQMCRAMGMNTVCMYIFWNFHEPIEGEFTFEGQADIRKFAKMVQEEGMLLIVRPGPYVCAEWDMGGLPWWLLKNDTVRLREQEPYFMERLKIFEKKVAEQLADLTVKKGGPIIMIQVENEYGSYGEDKPYVAAVRDALRGAGWDGVQMFQCDWASNFQKNALDGLLWTMNFGCGANIEKQFKTLGEVAPSSPRMCSEYWSGWFDKWGARHETRPTDKLVKGMGEMLASNISFSLYMAHGGTNFGHWAGSNSPGYNPDVTSYDYDAPITEQGRATEKYDALRELLAGHSKEPLPAVPEAIPVMELDTFSPSVLRPLRIDGAEGYRRSPQPLTLEQMDCGWGVAVYRHAITEDEAKATYIVTDAVRDYGLFFAGNDYLGTLYRGAGESVLYVADKLTPGDTLTVVVDCMGRINFGRSINDRKGLVGEVAFQKGNGETAIATDWLCAAVPDEPMARAGETYEIHRRTEKTEDDERQEPSLLKMGYYKSVITLDKTADTYLDMRHWGKGMVWVNGHCLGRFWGIGPQQTLYTPGCYLKKGANEVVVLDLSGPRDIKLWGADRPEVNLLQKVDQRTRYNKPVVLTDALNLKVRLEDLGQWSAQKLAAPAKAKLVCLEFDMPQSPLAVSEIELLGKNGQPLDKGQWKVVMATSEDRQSGNFGADKLIDLQEETTAWKPLQAGTHKVVIDLGSEQAVTVLRVK